jgi:hypothetical protein
MKQRILDLEKWLASEEFQRFLDAFGYKIEDFTCNTCKYKKDCPSSFDPYNTDGDCLEGK